MISIYPEFPAHIPFYIQQGLATFKRHFKVFFAKRDLFSQFHPEIEKIEKRIRQILEILSKNG